ncbi:AlpA family transcriptional regulator [Laribacter hongkongensis]|uniref:helix-turn-helix transcriptional regulator n=1 Tax=Laribacter hongkongensis TaxID=168471 RepID=UPI001EFEEF66|nr:AlpA family transcriptional regulator [Laribacter hongkongensis]MCG9065048.1 AlpA family transcriptional regulator [Laribacter hongkongensis]
MKNPPDQRAIPPPERFIRLKEVIRLTGLSRPTIYRRISTGQFPQSIPIGGGKVAWLYSELWHWMQSRIKARSSSTYSKDSCQ